jgi:hypothetical protein
MCLSALFLALLIAPVVLAQSLGATINSVDVSQFPKVRVLANVADAQGISITNLDAQAFDLREDDQPVDGLRVDSIVDSREPVDCAGHRRRGSMGDDGKLDNAKAAASARRLARSPAIARRWSVRQRRPRQPGLHGRSSQSKSAIESLNADGDDLYDAVAQTAQLQGALPQRRSAGAHHRWRGHQEQAERRRRDRATQQAGLVVFAIGLGDKVNHDVLNQIAGANGQRCPSTRPTSCARTSWRSASSASPVRARACIARATRRQAARASLKANYRGQTSDVKGPFNARRSRWCSTCAA